MKFAPLLIDMIFTGQSGAGTNTLSILRIKLKLHFVQNVEPDPREIGFAFHRAGTEIGQKGAFCKGLECFFARKEQVGSKEATF